MADVDLVQRVEKLEETVDSIRDLPERTTRLEVRVGNVETQIVHMRDEMRSGFSAMKVELGGEIAAARTELKGEISAVRTELKGEIAAVRTELREDIAELSRDLSAKFLDMGSQLQVRIEALQSVIATTREGNPPAN
jgi:hypothetical protein